MKRSSKLFAATLLGVACSSSLFAGLATFNFDVDPSTDPNLSGAIIVGNHNYANGNGNAQIWSSGAGTAVDGNPSSGGYLSIADATNGNNGLAFVFPDIDNGLPLNGFQIDLDLRVGNGTLGRPADGFSISFARAGDQALRQATNGALNGFAGGDGSVSAAAATGGSGDVENGTKTGVAVLFDAWQGNYLPDTLPYATPPAPPAGIGAAPSSASTDREGIAVRLDDQTLTQIDLIYNRNIRDCVPTTQTTLNNNATGLSMQTGTNAVVVSGTQCARVYGAVDASGSYVNLSWQHLFIRLTNNPTPVCVPPSYNLTVTWKGVVCVNTNLPSFSPFAGRLVLAGRCGGNNQNCHVDNIALRTVPANGVVLASINGLLNGFTFTLADNPPNTFAGIVQVLLDVTNNVTGSTTVNYVAPTTTGVYQQATKFAPGSTHQAQVCWRDNNNNTNSTALSFTVPQWIQMPTNQVIPFSAVDTTKPGMRVLVNQSLQANPNQGWWTDQQLEGRRGPSIAAASSLPTESDGTQTYKVWDGLADFINGQAVGTPQHGFFNGTLSSDNDFELFGLGLSGLYPAGVGYDIYQNSAMEMFSYVYFPTSGVYNMVMGSDDGFQLSVSQNPLDRMGQVLWFLNGSRVPTAGSPPNFSDIRPVVVDAPGVYAIRLMWENGGGGAALEWYTTPSALQAAIANVNSFLVNDTNNVGNAVLLYRALNGTFNLGPYIKDADPVRGDPDVVFYAPIIMTLADGQGSRTINDSTIAVTVDGSALATSKTRSGGTVRVTQTSTPNWSGGLHTNVVTFADNLGTNYNYTWTFTVLGGASGVARCDTTNTAGGYISIPASFAVPLGQVDTSQRGWRIRSYQSVSEAPGDNSFYEEQIQGMHGVSVADYSGTNGPGFYIWGDANHPFGGPGAFDVRHSFNDALVAGGGGLGKYAYDIYNNPVDYAQFGLGALRGNTYPNNIRLGGSHAAETASLEIGTWLYFPNPGTYILYFNTDDGCKLSVPYGSLRNKLGFVVFNDNVGRGMANGGGVETGGSYAKVVIPTTGAYPFRLMYFNSGTDAGIEWSIFQQLADGTVKRVAINDSNIPGSIAAYQTLLAGDTYGPYVSYASPVFASQDMMSWQNIVVDLTDGPGTKAVNSATIALTTDGSVRIPGINHPSAGITHIVYTPPTYWLPGGHTNILTFQDNAGTTYSNWYTFTVPTQTFPANPVNIALIPPAAIEVPLSNKVDISAVDISKPGFRVKSYQIPSPAGPNNTAWTEEVFEGLRGANIANQSGAVNGYFSYNGPVDFADNINYGGFAQSGEYRYNLAMSNTFGIVLNGGGAEEQNACLMFAGWMQFPQAGYYVMTFNSDDGFKISSPYGRNAFSQAGTILGYNSTGRGNNSGYNANPFALGGSVSPAFFHIPAAGVYPIRAIYENGGGGINCEWTMYQYYTNGDVARVIVGSTNDPGAYPIYQSLLVDEPYLSGVFPSVGTTQTQPGGGLFNAGTGNNGVGFGFVGPDFFLLPGTGATNIAGQIEDLTLQLTDGLSRTVNTNTISLTFNGISQPVEITGNGAGVWTIIRRANTQPFWPSGGYGPLVLSYQDNNGQQLSQSWNLATAFWGTLTNGYSLSQIDTTKNGFAMHIRQADPGVSPATTVAPTRIHVYEQILAGLYGPNTATAAQTNPVDGAFFDIVGTGRSNGVVNFVINNGFNNGDFQGPVGSGAAGGNFIETIFPGTPGIIAPTTTTANSNNSFAVEFLSYVEFPTNGTYILGVSSDDGFRVTRGLNAPTNIGALVVNSPGSVAGTRPAVQNTSFTSTFLTNPITGNLFAPNGIAFQQGSTTNGEGCVITDPFGSTSGKILIMYRSAFCSYAQQVQNAVAAGAIGVIFIQNRPVSTGEGPFPQEPGVFPPQQPIPAIEIRQSDGAALIAALANNTVAVNVTMTKMENIINPPAGPAGPLGQVDIGKGASDVLFPVVVQQAGVYPLRLMYFEGGGGANCEFFSVTGTNRTLINDRTATNGPGPGGSGLRAFFPTMSLTITLVGPNAVITFGGKLQSAPAVTGPWTDVVAATSSPYTTPASSAAAFYRAVLLN